MKRRCKVFIVEHDRDAMEMLKTLVEQNHGCEVNTALVGDADNFARIKTYAPDLVILDFIYGRSENWRLLDQLRIDATTSLIPVLAMSTAETVVEQSLASYNVRTVLAKPFALDEFDRSVQTILSEPRLAVPPVPERPGAEVLREAADILAASAREIVADWLRRVNEVEPFKTKKKLRPRQLVDHVPVLLWGNIVAPRTGEYRRLFEQFGTFQEAAKYHARLRREQGVALGSLIHEYEILRDSIWRMLWDKPPKDRWTIDDVFRVGEIVHLALDEMVAIAAEHYRQAEEQAAA